MKKVLFVGLALATALVSAPTAKADSFLISFSGTGITGNGTISGSSLPGGEFSITSANMTINGFNATVIANPNPNPQGVANDDLSAGTISLNAPAQDLYHNWIDFDNILTPANAPYVDGYGLLFLLSDGGVLLLYDYNYNDFLSWNEFLNGAWVVGNTLDDQERALATAGDPISNADIIPTPEPFSLLLFGSGLVLMAGFVFWKRRPNVVREA
jgi:hypothetical protein